VIGDQLPNEFLATNLSIPGGHILVDSVKKVISVDRVERSTCTTSIVLLRHPTLVHPTMLQCKVQLPFSTLDNVADRCSQNPQAVFVGWRDDIE